MSLRRRLQTSVSFRRAATKVRDVLPFGVRRLLQTAWNTDVFAKPRFAGLYQSFEAVPNPTNPPIDSETIRLSLGSMRHDGGNGFVIFRHGHDLLSVVAAMLGGGELSVLDFGGAAGLDYKGLKAATDSVGHYCVVELPEICRLASNEWPGGDEGRLTFRHDLPPPTERFDVVYAYSAIHYVPCR
jgi:putative methyltransferase (TIGR04325 family)